MGDLTWLVEAVAERLQAVVPTGFPIWVEEGRATWVEDPSASLRIQRVAEALMSDVQDAIAEELRRPWPGDRTMPMPAAEIRGGQLHLWFGERDSPTLVLRPIQLPRDAAIG
jgi:hypothetical protein